MTDTNILEQKFSHEKIDSLKEHPQNPRQGDKAAIDESVTQNGFYGALIVQRSTRYVLAGNHRWQVLKTRGVTTIPVLWVDVDEPTALRILFADNRTGDRAGYNPRKLLEGLQQLQDGTPAQLRGTGYQLEDLKELLAKLRPFPNIQEAEVPEAGGAAATVSELGELYELGPHRLLCGDASDPRSWSTLLGGEKLQAIITDPPYGIELVGGAREIRPADRKKLGKLEIQNDALQVDDLEAFLLKTLRPALDACVDGSPWYVFAPPGRPGLAFAKALTELEVWQHKLIWEKDTFVLSRVDYHYQHEDLFYGWKPGRHFWCGRRDVSTTLRFPRPRNNKHHPSMKPVELLRHLLGNSTKADWLVGDGFGGSGATLIACAYEARRGRLIELDPRYCDVIRRRWTGWAKAAGVPAGSGALE